MTIRKITFLVQEKETDEKSYVEIPFRLDQMHCDLGVDNEAIDKIWIYIKGYIAGKKQ